MGTITKRERNDGTFGYRVQIRIKANGKVIHTQTKTFEKSSLAKAWMKKRETELAVPGALDKPTLGLKTLSDAIDKYISESRGKLGHTKAQLLRTIKNSALGQKVCSAIESKDIVEFAMGLNVLPQTVSNYLAHMAPIFTVAPIAWGFKLDKQAFEAARVVCKQLGATSKSRSRDRRPTLQELDTILKHFGIKSAKSPQSLPMQDLIVFALFSTRRQEEITRIAIEGLDIERSEVVVRDMKHPGEKVGNDVRVHLPWAARAICKKHMGARRQGPIFPFNADSISASFTRAMTFLGIEDLHFHDLRHEGVTHQPPCPALPLGQTCRFVFLDRH
jgi:integrase